MNLYLVYLDPSVIVIVIVVMSLFYVVLLLFSLSKSDFHWI